MEHLMCYIVTAQFEANVLSNNYNSRLTIAAHRLQEDPIKRTKCRLIHIIFHCIVHTATRTTVKKSQHKTRK